MKGASSVSCDPMWQSMPTISKHPQRVGLAIDSQCLAEGDAEFVLLQPGRDIRMRFGVDIRVDADAHRRLRAHLPGDAVQSFQFAFRFDVEALDACGERLAHVVAALAHAGEYGLSRIAAGRNHACQFAARNDVETAAHSREQIQDGKIRIGFHRVADQMRSCPEGPVVVAESLLERRAGIDKARRAELHADLRQRDVFGKELAVAQRKDAHFSMVPSSVFLGSCFFGLSPSLGR